MHDFSLTNNHRARGLHVPRVAAVSGAIDDGSVRNDEHQTHYAQILGSIPAVNRDTMSIPVPFFRVFEYRLTL